MNVTNFTRKKRVRKIYPVCVLLFMAVLSLFFVMGKSTHAARSLSGPAVDVNSGLVAYHYVYLGYYPQTEVNPDELTDDIVNAGYDSDDMAVVGDAAYKRVLSSASADTYTYFIVEPIRWRILENDGAYLTLQSAQVLDCLEYDLETGVEYDESSLRIWLNNVFFNAAFVNGASDGLKAVYRDDRITLPGEADIEDESYGMSTENCVLTVSDYALFRGCYSANFTGNSAGTYWIRSSGMDSKYVDSIGELQLKAASDKDCGVAPVIRVSVDEYYYSAEAPLLKNPEINAETGSTKWNVVYFGTYPQTEIINPEESIVRGNYKDDIAVVDGIRYKRIPENNSYRYFRYDAIRWRVLRKDNGKYLLQCDSIIEMYQRDVVPDSTRYPDSDLGEWLNTDFYETAFAGAARKNLVADAYGDYVDIISDSLMQSPEYGYQNDSSRILRPSSYAEAVSRIGKEESAVCWFRSEENNIDGYINNHGSIIYYAPTGIKGICPVITLNEIPYVWSLSEDLVVMLPTETDIPSPSPDGSVVPVETQLPLETAAQVGTEYPSETAPAPVGTPTASPAEMPKRYFTTKRPVVAVKSKSADSHKLSWGKIAGATGYSIYRSTSREGTYDLYSTVSGTSALIKNLKIGKKYHYVIIAYKASNGKLSYSRSSQVVSKRAGNPRKPRITVAMSRNNGKKYVTIHWQNVSDAKFIQMYRSRGGKKYERILDAKISRYKKGVTITYKKIKDIHKVNHMKTASKTVLKAVNSGLGIAGEKRADDFTGFQELQGFHAFPPVRNLKKILLPELRNTKQ